MIISGFEKFSLIDYPGKTCCVIFLHGCNFKCRFCYNPQLVIEKSNKNYSEEEILSFLKKRMGKLDGICISGGEPLLSLEKKFLKKIKSLGYKIKLDTNGSLPDKLKELIDEKLIDYIAMDIKCSKESYAKITQTEINIKNIEKSIRELYNFENSEFRTTIIKNIHTETEIINMLKWIQDIINHKKIKNLSFQGFKNTGNFIDPKFKKDKNTNEIYLKKIKKIAKNYCDKINIK